MSLEIKKLEYDHEAMLEYVVQDTKVVYCGITNIRDLPDTASTTNAAAKILKALAGAVGSSIDKPTFFELTTFTSWDHKPGEYDFQNVYINRDGEAVYTRSKPSAIILETFRHRIGGDVMHQYKSEDHLDYGRS
jgi:hypothetical protein